MYKTAKLDVYYLLLMLLKICFSEDIKNTTDTIEHLKTIIQEGLANASTYSFPTNADMYKPHDDKISEYGAYDFVIIGAGTTGAVIASRLSENKNFTVLVLEAGKWPNSELFQIMGYVFPLTLSEYNWAFKSTSQTTACLGMVDQQCFIVQGRGVGGTTLVDAGTYCRGSPQVSNKWAKLLNDTSWSYDNVLRLYKKSEDFVHRNPWAPVDEEYHGTGGPLHVEQALPPDELTGVFLEANRKLGLKVRDYNGPYQGVASVFQQYTKDGRRQDVGTAFLKPAMKRKNLEILPESYVTRIEINKATKVAKGVTFTRHGKTYYVSAKKEVILSAGIFSSPRILMLSGIGPRKHLQEVGVDLVEDLEVGSALTDHVINNSFLFSSNIYTTVQTLEEQLNDYLHGVGTLTTIPKSQGLAFYKTSNRDFDDLELYSQTTEPSAFVVKLTNWKKDTYQATWGDIKNALQVVVFLTNPLSRGTVRLQSNSPFDYPLIDLNLLSDRGNKDIDTMYEGIEIMMKLLKTAPFQRLGVKYEGKPVPGCEDHKFLSKGYWYCFLRHTSTNGYHTTGTCPMGLDPRKGAVVDADLRVYGIRGLRVADASVFPTTSARPPKATCIMIGEKISEVIKTLYI